MSTSPTVENIKRYQDLTTWLQNPKHLYIGRDMSWVKHGANASKWQNPYTVAKFGRSTSINKYKTYIRATPSLFNSLYELEDKVLGCWCSPQPCHGHALVELYNNKHSM